MPSKELPNNLSTEELLESVSKEPEKKTEETFQLPEILDFLSVFKISRGDYQITSKLLFKLYTKWSKHPISFKAFSMEISDYLEKYQIRNQYGYLINIQDSVLTEDVLKSLDVKKEVTDSVYLRQHYESFLKYCNIKSSNSNYIEGFLLYELYKKWSKYNRSKNPLSYSTFLKFARLFLPQERMTENRTNWFGISKKPEELFDPVELDFLRKKQNAKEKKKKQKDKSQKSSEVSSS